MLLLSDTCIIYCLTHPESAFWRKFTWQTRDLLFEFHELRYHDIIDSVHNSHCCCTLDQTIAHKKVFRGFFFQSHHHQIWERQLSVAREQMPHNSSRREKVRKNFLMEYHRVKSRMNKFIFALLFLCIANLASCAPHRRHRHRHRYHIQSFNETPQIEPKWWETNQEIQFLQEYLRIPSVHPDPDYGENLLNLKIDLTFIFQRKI